MEGRFAGSFECLQRLCDRKMHEAKIGLPTNHSKEPWPFILRQTDIKEGVNVNDLLALMDSDDGKVLIDHLSLSLTPQSPVTPIMVTSDNSA